MSFISELKRRDVLRVGAAYAVIAWLLLQVADVILPTFEAPIWMMQVLTVVLVLGFPLALIFAWLFELTPEGVRPDTGREQPDLGTRIKRRKMDFAIFGMMAAAIVLLVVDRFLLEETPRASGGVLAYSERSIAVLPFANRSALPEDAFFVDGIHDDILTQLAKLSAMEKVISRTSVEQYRETAKTMPKIGQELGVAKILEGGVQRAGDRIRINVQLIDAVTDEHQWAEIYDRQMTVENIFAIQSEIATAIVGELQATLSAQERDTISSVPTQNMAALEKYFLGNAQLEERTARSLRAAGEYFQAAIDLDPSFALAYVGLANVHNLHPMKAGTPWEDEVSQARALVLKALELDNSLAAAYVQLGISETWTNYDKAESAYKRAIELSPNNVLANAWYCYLLDANLGRPADALPLCRKSFELDPMSPLAANSLGEVYSSLGRYEDAEIQFRKAIELDPEFAYTYNILAWLNWSSLARLDVAVKSMRQSIALDPEFIAAISVQGQIYLDLGDIDQAEYWINHAMRLAPESAEALMGNTYLQVVLGNIAAAAEFGRRRFELSTSWGFSLQPIRDRLLQAGRLDDARALYEKYFPELLNDSNPRITPQKRIPALDLALVLAHTGERERMDLLLRLVMQDIQTVPRLSTLNGYGIADVHIYAIQGDRKRALSSLRQAVDEGWRLGWRYDLIHDLKVESIRDEPEFQAVVAELEAEMAEQLARLREWDAAGELAPIPKSLLEPH